MKKYVIIAFCLIGIAIAGNAQTKPVVLATIKTPNALCPICKTKIETYLKRYDGVMEINVNYRKGETRVKYITDRTDIEQIKTAIGIQNQKHLLLNSSNSIQPFLSKEGLFYFNKPLIFCFPSYRTG